MAKKPASNFPGSNMDKLPPSNLPKDRLVSPTQSTSTLKPSNCYPAIGNGHAVDMTAALAAADKKGGPGDKVGQVVKCYGEDAIQQAGPVDNQAMAVAIGDVGAQ